MKGKDIFGLVILISIFSLMIIWMIAISQQPKIYI